MNLTFIKKFEELDFNQTDILKKVKTSTMLKDYIQQVRSAIELKLQEDGGDRLLHYQECLAILADTMDAIRLELNSDPFVDRAEEIFFYKEMVPVIWGQHFFYQRLVKIEARRKFQSKDRFRAGLRRLLRRANAYPEEHEAICAYYYEGRTDADERFFTRSGTRDVFLDRGLTTAALELARMRQYELLRDWLNKELVELPERGSKLQWNIGPTETIELFWALFANDRLGDDSFEHVMRWVKDNFEVNTDNHSVIVQHIRDRKKSVTKFLDDLTKGLKEAIEGKL